jgi:hypothetical protein
MSWFAVDRFELASTLDIPPETRDHATAAAALEKWLVAQRGGAPGDVLALMKREGRYRVLPDEEARAEVPIWFEAQWETLLFDRAGARQVYRAPWTPPDWESVAKDLARAIGLPFLRDAARRGLFGFRSKHGLLGFLTLREVRETLKSWGTIDQTRFRGTALRLLLIEEIQASLRAASGFDRELVMSLV